jgi:tetratricopeptide (TPR) repeat protein
VRPGPALEPPEEVSAEQLDREVRAGLRGLGNTVADRVARHLVAAGLLVDDDPDAALAHARAARGLGARVPAVREAVGIAAYHAGEYAEALAELRAARRMDGSQRNIAVMADAERGLGRPERALAVVAEAGNMPDLDEDTRVELLIVASGARRDLGQAAAAVVVLQVPQLRSTAVQPWTARLWYAYAEALAAAGRPGDALTWFTATATVDEGGTDAAARAAELSGEPVEDVEILDTATVDDDRTVDSADGVADADSTGDDLADQARGADEAGDADAGARADHDEPPETTPSGEDGTGERMADPED